MNILIIGDGGREHVLTHLASQSEAVEKIYCLGQNAGILSEPKCERLVPTEPGLPAQAGHIGIINLAKENNVDLIIVGPEQPLADGIVNDCRAAGLSIFGPTKEAARLESDKKIAKEMMVQSGVPTAKALDFNKSELQMALSYLDSQKFPIVIKANGLAAGKGVAICDNKEVAKAAILDCFVFNKFGTAGHDILIEEFLIGDPRLPRAKLSIIALVDIHGNFVMMLPAQDYKPVFDRDLGPNTGGMGSYAPVPWVTQEFMDQVGRQVFAPIINAMKKAGTPFSGALYAGLMVTANGFKVIEFNCRFGDPEIQPLSMLLENDLIKIMKHIADGGNISDLKLYWRPGAAVCVVMAMNGYPGPYRKGAKIEGLETIATGKYLQIFHAGTAFNDKKEIITTGGRVLGVTGHSDTGMGGGISHAIAYSRSLTTTTLKRIGWIDDWGSGAHYRKDIAKNVPSHI